MTHTSLIYDAFQYATVVMLVVGCAGYCVLALAPNAVKERLRNALRRLPLPKAIINKISQTRVDSACGANCGGCTPSPSASKKVNWAPRHR